MWVLDEGAPEYLDLRSSVKNTEVQERATDEKFDLRLKHVFKWFLRRATSVKTLAGKLPQPWSVRIKVKD